MSGTESKDSVVEEQFAADRAALVLQAPSPKPLASQQTPYRRELADMIQYEKTHVNLADPDRPFFGRIDYDDAVTVRVGKHVIFDGNDAIVSSWRAPAAEAFYLPHLDVGVLLRRRIQIESGHVRAVSDERRPRVDSSIVSTNVDDPLDQQNDTTKIGAAQLVSDEWLSSMLQERCGQLDEVVATIQGDQFAAISAASNSPLIIEGGPGTGKTIVLLHRLAYLLYEAGGQRRIGAGPCVVVGPTDEFIRYVQHVLPALGEGKVQHRTIDQLLSERLKVVVTLNDPPEVAQLKGDKKVLGIIDKYLKKPLPEIADHPFARRSGNGLAELRFDLPAELIQQCRIRAQGTDRTYNNGREAFRSGLEPVIRVFLEELLEPTIPRPSTRRERVEQELKIMRDSGAVNRLAERCWPTIDTTMTLKAIFGNASTLRELATGVFTKSKIDMFVGECHRYTSDELRLSSADVALMDYLETRIQGGPSKRTTSSSTKCKISAPCNSNKLSRERALESP